MPNVEDVQRHLTDNINAITWAGLEVRGTTYHFKIVENEPKKEKEQRPQNLVAKKAIITKTFVEVGKPVVLKNDHVEKGKFSYQEYMVMRKVRRLFQRKVLCMEKRGIHLRWMSR